MNQPNRDYRVKCLLPFILLSLILVFTTFSASADESVEQLLERARYSATLQHQDLHGRIKKSGKETPVSLFLRGKDIQFSYRVGDKNKAFHMRFNNNKYDLFDIVDKKTTKFNSKQISQKINNTDLSFEDLSMRFLYWKQGTIVGEERVSGQKCYKIRLINPEKTGDYRIVYVWLHKKHGALMRVVGYNNQGQALKRFQVTDLMKVRKDYTLKRMRIDSFDPATNKSVGVTYLEFDKPKAASRIKR